MERTKKLKMTPEKLEKHNKLWTEQQQKRE
jgi:hypothetical protein